MQNNGQNEELFDFNDLDEEESDKGSDSEGATMRIIKRVAQ